MTAPISDRKRAANQANALKSTGPRTVEGKAKVRLNALVHGLRAETVVLPYENVAEFEAMRAGWIEDWKPETEARLALVERAAAGVWRLRRCVKVEHDRLTDQMNNAVAAYDERVQTRRDEGLRVLRLNPARGLEELSQEHAGVSALIGRWESLKRHLQHFRAWSTYDHHCGLLMMLGYAPETSDDEIGPVALESKRLLIWNNPEHGPSDRPIANDAEATAVALALTEFTISRIADLQTFLATFPDPELIRARVAESAAYDVSREGLALQRYEGQLDRSFRANLNQLIKLAKSGSDLIEAETLAEPSRPIKPTDPQPERPIKPTEAANAPKSANKPTEFDPMDDFETSETPYADADLVLEACQI